jgi:hypothetical protein
MPIRSFGVGCGVFHKFSGQLPPRRGSGLQRFPVGSNFQILAGKGRKAEVLELQFDTLENGYGAETVMGTDDPSEAKQLQHNLAKLADLLEIQLSETRLACSLYHGRLDEPVRPEL